jgi:hypothetical protein
MADAHKINAAIRECLDQCYASQTPLPCLAGYIAMLRADSEWREADVFKVEVAVRQMLKGVLSEPESDTMS